LNNETETKVINFDDSRIIYKDEKFDIVIIEIKPSDKINYSFLEIDEDCSTKKDVNNYNNALVYILGYPYGNDCTFSLGKMNVAETDNEKCIFHKITY
jgi:GH18 family chitinase